VVLLWRQFAYRRMTARTQRTSRSPERERKNMKLEHMMIVGVLGLWVTLAGCGKPGYTSSMRTTFAPETPLELKCIRHLDAKAGDFRDEAEQLYAQGWRLAYLSEYTSTGKTNFVFLGCFERPRAR